MKQNVQSQYPMWVITRTNWKSRWNEEKLCSYWNNMLIPIIVWHWGIPDLNSAETILCRSEKKPCHSLLNTHSFQKKNNWVRLIGTALWKSLGHLTQVYWCLGKYKVECVAQKADGQEQFEIYRCSGNILVIALEHLISACFNVKVLESPWKLKNIRASPPRPSMSCPGVWLGHWHKV